MKLQVTYNGKPDKGKDKRIQELAKLIGAKWYAQGYNFETDKRDINFDIRR